MCVELIGRVRGLLISYKINGWAQHVFLFMYFYLMINNGFLNITILFLWWWWCWRWKGWAAQWSRARSRFVELQVQPQRGSISIVWIKHLTHTVSVTTGYQTLKTTLTEEWSALYGDRATSVPTLAPICIIRLKILDQPNKRAWRMYAWRW